MDSILTTVKKMLMIQEDYEHFDLDIIMHINSVFSILFQLGVGPQNKQFRISDKTALWTDFTGDEETIELVKSYMYLKLKLLFDPPEAGFVLTSYQEQIKEYEWRLNVAVDPKNTSGGHSGSSDDILDALYKGMVGQGYTGSKDDLISNLSGIGGGNAVLKEELAASIGAGGIRVGDIFIKGEELENLWRALLDPVKNPTLTGPSVSLTASGGTLMENGETRSVSFIAVFDRGSISPANGTSGFRSGPLVNYQMDSDIQDGSIFIKPVDKDNATFVVFASYEEGEQPKNSKGEDYDVPLPAGTVTSNVVTFEFVDTIWSNQNDILTVSKEGLVSKSAKSKTFNFPAQTKTDVETFDIPASWNVTKIEVYNEISRAFEDDASEFTVTRVTHKNAADEDVEYRRYSDNRGYAAGPRQIRVSWA